MQTRERAHCARSVFPFIKKKTLLMSLQSVPKSCIALVICSCKKGCNPNRCGCLKTGYLACTSACNCEWLCQIDEHDQ